MNKFYLGDNLSVLSDIKEECQLIYIDPPYNTGRNFGDYSDSWKSMTEYREEFLRPRIQLCHSMLKKNGTIIVHVEPNNSHHIRILLDDIFGEKNFRNEIAWKTGGNAKNIYKLGRMHDTIIVYSKSSNYVFNPQYIPYDQDYLAKTKKDERGQYTTTSLHNSQPDVNPRPNLRYEWNGNVKQWYVTKDKMQTLHDENRLVYNENGIPRIKRYVDEMDGIPITDLWTDISNTQGTEKVDYATQKPIQLLDRIIRMYTNEGDLVGDLFSGSGSTAISALKNNRKYVVSDINPKSEQILTDRIEKLTSIHNPVLPTSMNENNLFEF